jgi:hypothetical protein
MHIDEPVAVMAAAAFSIAGGVIGAWWQRRRSSRQRDVGVQTVDAGAIDARLERLEQLAEISAVEIERIAEGQRFTTKVLVERAEPAKSATAGRRNTDPPRVVTPH